MLKYLSAISFHLIFSIYTSSIIGQESINGKFNFIAFGDMPYVLPDDYSGFENLITDLNKQDQAFNVFVGDIKSSKTKCSEEIYQKVHDYFDLFKKPLIYTPGDNEWTDCHKIEAGAYDPEERLQVIRRMFFTESNSAGKEKIKLKLQSDIPGYESYRENRRWNYHNISFGTVHLVGSNNNFNSESKNNNKEFFERSLADIYWLKEIFKSAMEDESLGIVLFVHADMFEGHSEGNGFNAFLKELQKLTTDYAKPVLLVNGDAHEFKVDKPFYTDMLKKKSLLNFTRMQVFGEADIHAVKVEIDPGNPCLFTYRELWIPANK